MRQDWHSPEPKQADHSVFMALAPREDPQIAVSVYVEYAGAGGEWAAPIAGLLVEKYVTGDTPTPNAPIGSGPPTARPRIR